LESDARKFAIASEAKAREADAMIYESKLAAEQETRIAADDTIRADLVAEVDARLLGDSREATARIAADAALGGRLDREESERKFADAVLNDQIASSIATAIALGGALVLPDADFTLSGNLGFYKGAKAVAFNGAARVSRSTYVTAAFGGGLNKRGTVGGRVGFAVGF